MRCGRRAIDSSTCRWPKTTGGHPARVIFRGWTSRRRCTTSTTAARSSSKPFRIVWKPSPGQPPSGARSRRTRIRLHETASRFSAGSSTPKAAARLNDLPTAQSLMTTLRALSRRPCLAIALGICIGLLTARPAPAQSTTPDKLQVLFLGDDGHHQPAARVRQILPFMAGQGIDIFYTERLSTLNPDVLSRYDVVMLYANHPHLSAEREQALLDFVAGGGGLVAVHCASAMFGNSDAYISLVGGAFKSHGADSFRTDIVLPEHPAIQGVPNFASWDETYVHTKHNPDKEVLSVRRTGAHEEPWTWVRTHGEGRVFYTAWGHDGRTWSKSGFQELLNRG